MAFGMNASFNEPDSEDNTSAPPMPLMNQSPPTKKKPYGPKVKNPSALSAAIARAKRAKQTGHKYGA